MADTPPKNDNPPADGVEQEPVKSPVVKGIPEGLYVLVNRKTRTVLDLDGGDTKSGASCVGWQRNVNEKIDHQLWAIRPGEDKGSYRIMSFRGGTFLDLEAGKQENKSRVVAWKKVTNDARQHQLWKISDEVAGYHTIQCFKTNTFLEVTDGKTDNGAGISCSSRAGGDWRQFWELDRVSQKSSAIKELFELWKPGMAKKLIKPYGDDIQYFVLPLKLRDTIWENTKLARQAVRAGTFDYDDFVIKMKDAVNTWARDRLRLDGYSLLWGIIYGEAQRGPKAYNWTLSSDLRSLVFFDPQTNREYTASRLDEFAFEPTVAIF